MTHVQSVSPNKGVAWIGQGWRNFKRSPGMWIVLGSVAVTIFILLSSVGTAGGLIAWLVSPMLAGGLLFAAREADEGRPVLLIHLLQGFHDSRVSRGILVLGATLVGMALVSMVIGLALIGEAVLTRMYTDPTAVSFATLGSPVLIGLLLVLCVQLLVLSAVTYALPLIMFDNESAGAAMRASVLACVRNILPLLVFSVAYFVLVVAAAIPLTLLWAMLFPPYTLEWLPVILGWVLLPPSVAMLYASYRDCFQA